MVCVWETSGTYLGELHFKETYGTTSDLDPTRGGAAIWSVSGDRAVIGELLTEVAWLGEEMARFHYWVVT